MGIGIGIANGIPFLNFSGLPSVSECVTQNFKDRVIADGGTFEGQDCLIAYLDTIVSPFSCPGIHYRIT